MELEWEEMDRDTTRLRAARPEFGDGLLFARYMDQAAEGFFGFMLGANAENIIASAFRMKCVRMTKTL